VEKGRPGQPRGGGGSRIFDPESPSWKFAELENRRGTDAIHLAFREDFAGDRVLAFIAGIGGMVQTAFDDKTELFMLDDLDPQKLYNARAICRDRRVEAVQRDARRRRAATCSPMRWGAGSR
jgi:hypothetical protein